MNRTALIALLLVVMLAIPVLARVAASQGVPVGLSALAALLGAGAVLAWYMLGEARRRPPRR